jgi:uncharacterized protein YceH (UPF0502 family)
MGRSRNNASRSWEATVKELREEIAALRQKIDSLFG